MQTVHKDQTHFDQCVARLIQVCLIDLENVGKRWKTFVDQQLQSLISVSCQNTYNISMGAIHPFTTDGDGWRNLLVWVFFLCSALWLNVRKKNDNV